MGQMEFLRAQLMAESTVVVCCQRPAHSHVGELMTRVIAQPSGGETALVAIDVVYDGPDLAVVAEHCGLSIDSVIDRHAAGRYVVAFCGFSPGFAYLRGLDPELHLARRSSPRTTVPAGSVAIAAGYTSIYPSASPGGWHLLGRTATAVWDTGRPQPALLSPGTVVEFRQVLE